MTVVRVDTERFLADLDALREIGRYRSGVHRPTFGPEDMESRRWLMARLTEVGLQPTLDGIGNVFGRYPGTGPHLLAGSHIETQNHSGWLDGALGVLSALALARAGLPVDVCAYCDEEGHWGDFLGSRSLVGEVDEAELDGARDRNGTPLRAALRDVGLDGLPRLRLDPSRYRCALELHIEQGTGLETAGARIGVVTGIVAIRHFRIVVEGQQDHTGGTTMAERRDAGLTAVRLLADLDAAFPTVCGARSVWTTGRLVLEPNQPMIIPGRAEVNFSFRDLDEAVMDRMEACLLALVRESNRRERCAVRLEPISRIAPVLCADPIRDAFAAAAERLCPGAWQLMPSGAIHDSQILGRHMPVGMLFVPSIGGVSHHWTEDTRREDLTLGVEVMAEAAATLLTLPASVR